MEKPAKPFMTNPGGQDSEAAQQSPLDNNATVLLPGLDQLRMAINGWPVFYSFGKNLVDHEEFSRSMGACTMNAPGGGYGLGIPKELTDENQIRSIFVTVLRQGGGFLFNLCYVDVPRAVRGFTNYEEAAGNNLITEWELWLIMENDAYLEKTIFHNGNATFNFDRTNRTFTC